jgi:hypothetical protein
VGYDAGDVSNSLPSKALPSPMWHDMMSYCDYQWPSDYTYRGLMDRLRAENALPARVAPVPFAAAASISSPPFPASASGEASGAGPPMAAAASAPASIMLMGAPILANGDFITIVGTANVTRRTGTIDFVHRVQQANVRPPDPASPVRLRLIDRAGATIAEVPAPFLPNSDLSSGEDVAGVVDAAIPASADLKAVELVVAGDLAARYEAPVTVRLDATEIRTTASPPTPLVQGESPGSGAARRALRLEWGNRTAAATPMAGIRYDVQASRDGGQTWEVVANGLPSASAEVDLSGFDDVRDIEVRVIANAGFESKVIAQRKIGR